MRVLHYIPVLKADELTSDYVRTLAYAMRNVDEVRVMTDKDDVDNVIKEACPHIVHVHSCWDYDVLKVVKAAKAKGLALVLSPHNGLEPYTMRHEQRFSKQMKRALYQHKAVVSADALIATSMSEYDNLTALGWNKRIGLVCSPILNRTVSTRDMAETALAFYTKILDTRYFLRMSADEKEAFCSLLHVSKMRDGLYSQLTDKRLQNLRSLDDECWRRILLYADDEGVRPLIDSAIMALRLEVPRIDTSAIDRYESPMPKDMSALGRSSLPEDKTSMQERLDDEICEGEEVLRTICVMLLNAHHQFRRGTLSMRHIADLYDVIRYEDYDEDRLVSILKRFKIHKFASRILRILQDDLYLTEGFTPFEPLEDSGTGKIRLLTVR